VCAVETELGWVLREELPALAPGEKYLRLPLCPWPSASLSLAAIVGRRRTCGMCRVIEWRAWRGAGTRSSRCPRHSGSSERASR
jgi:hypothetical protein